MEYFPCSSSTKNDDSNCENYVKTKNLIRWKSGKRVDSRLLALLESFGEIYMDRHDLFGRIFRGDHEELFAKVGHAMKKTKTKMKTKMKGRGLRRSLSMGMVKERRIDDGIDGLKLERFKVRTPDVVVAGPDGGQGGQPKGSK